MRRFLTPFLALALALTVLLAAVPALAAGTAVVDFQRAVNETNEGKNAQGKLEQMYASRRGEIDRQRTELQTAIQDYEQRKLIMNDEARQQAEQDIYNKQRKLETDLVRYEQEMQQQYMQLVADLDQKMRAMTGTIAKEKGYDLVLDSQAVVYAGGSVIDMTDELIRRYNAK